MAGERILLLEDQAEMRRWLARAIETHFPTCHLQVAATLADARSLLEQHDFTLAIVDLGLPDGSGLSLLQRLPAECLSVVMTTFSDDEHLFLALRNGASGYVLKDMGHEHMARMLAECAQGRPPISPGIARRILQFFHQPRDSGLSARQEEVLALIGKGYSVAEVAGLMQISAHTVQGYVKEIYRKLGIHNRAEAAREAARLGLLGP